MKREDLFESIEKQIIAEKVYRNQIRNKLKQYSLIKEQEISNNKRKQEILENIYRAKLRNTFKSLFTLSEKKENYIHSSTGMNALEDLFSNTNILTVLGSDYKILTTSYEQRKDYRERIMELVLDLFSQKDISKLEDAKSIKESLQRLYEQDEADIQISIDDEEIPEDKIVGPKRTEIEQEKEQSRKDSENAKSINGKEDQTGVRRAEASFKKIENNIKNSYTTLGNPADRMEFKKYLIANLSMYFRQFEESLSNEPKADIPDDAKQAIEDAEKKIKSSESKGEDVTSAEISDETGSDEIGDSLGDLNLDL